MNDCTNNVTGGQDFGERELAPNGAADAAKKPITEADVEACRIHMDRLKKVAEAAALDHHSARVAYADARVAFQTRVAKDHGFEPGDIVKFPGSTEFGFGGFKRVSFGGCALVKVNIKADGSFGRRPTYHTAAVLQWERLEKVGEDLNYKDAHNVK